MLINISTDIYKPWKIDRTHDINYDIMLSEKFLQEIKILRL